MILNFSYLIGDKMNVKIKNLIKSIFILKKINFKIINLVANLKTRI